MTFQTFAWSKSLPGVGFDIIDNMVIGYKVMDIFDKIMRICLNQLYKQTYIQARWNWNNWRSNPNRIKTNEEIIEIYVIEGIKKLIEEEKQYQVMLKQLKK